MQIQIRNRCSDFNSYRAARVKSLFNAESGCNFDLDADMDLAGGCADHRRHCTGRRFQRRDCRARLGWPRIRADLAAPMPVLLNGEKFRVPTTWRPPAIPPIRSTNICASGAQFDPNVVDRAALEAAVNALSENWKPRRRTTRSK